MHIIHILFHFWTRMGEIFVHKKPYMDTSLNVLGFQFIL